MTKPQMKKRLATKPLARNPLMHAQGAHRGHWVFGAVVVALSVVTGSSAAYAYWTATGSGGGGASSSAGHNLVISAGSAAASLYPGGSGQIVLTITNSNDSIAHVNSLALDTASGSGGFAVDSGHSACTTALAALTYTTQSAGYDVPAHGSLPVTLPAAALTMGLGAASVCQGATFTVYLKVSS
jgi:hypothetical protein